MAAYTVNQRYSAFRDGVRFGPYEPGTVVDLDPADAEWVNRDSPGTLSAGAKATISTVEEPPASENRPLKGGRNRRG